MEPLNLMVSLSHFADPKPTIPPKQPRRRATTKPQASEPHRGTSARRALQWLRAITAR